MLPITRMPPESCCRVASSLNKTAAKTAVITGTRFKLKEKNVGPARFIMILTKLIARINHKLFMIIKVQGRFSILGKARIKIRLKTSTADNNRR